MGRVISARADRTTEDALKFFKRYKDSFGEIKSVRMRNIEGRYILILENALGEYMELIDTCTTGYYGEGSKATADILEVCGFPVGLEYVAKNTEFLLQK